MPDGLSTAHLYRPKLLTIIHEGYSRDHFRKDVTAALTLILDLTAGIIAGCLVAALLAAFRQPVPEEGA